MNTSIDYRIFGFGHSGSKILSQLVKDQFPSHRLFFFDTDARDIERHPSSNRYSLAKDVVGENGLKENVGLGRQAYQHEGSLFESLTSDDCLYIIVGGLGGGTFSGAGLALTAMLAQKQKRFVVVTSLPAAHERKTRQAIAIQELQFVNDFTDKVVLLSKTQVSSLFSQSGANAYREVDEQASRVIAELLTNTGLLLIETTATAEERMHDAIQLAVAYIHNSQIFSAYQDTQLIIARTHDALLEAIRVRPEVAMHISPRKFEELIAHLYEQAGYETELTKASRDHGVDIKAWTIAPLRRERFLTILQAKQKQRDSVGEAAIRDLIGARYLAEADRAGLITTTDFSKDALVAAKKEKIDLIKFYDLLEEAKTLKNTKINTGFIEKSAGEAR